MEANGQQWISSKTDREGVKREKLKKKQVWVLDKQIRLTYHENTS
jgi:hypothetical protein